MSRQKKRNEDRLKRKQVKKQRKELNEFVTKGDFIRYMTQMESNISILTQFINQRFPEEFKKYIEDIQKEYDKIESGEGKVEDAEVVSKSVFPKEEPKEAITVETNEETKIEESKESENE